MGDTSNLGLGWRTVMMGMACLPIIICAAFLLRRRVEKSASNYLAFFLIAAVLAVGPQIIGYAGFYDVWPGLTFFPLFATELWLGPLIYLHADKLMRGGPLGWRKYLLVPGIVQTIYYCWAFFTLGDYKAKWAYNGEIHAPYILPAENILTVALFLFTIIAIWKMVKRYRSHLDQTSSAALDYDPVWLRNLIIALILAGSVLAALELADTFMNVSYNAAFPFQVMSMLVIAWIAIEAVWRLNQFFPKMSPGQIKPPLPKNEGGQNWSENAALLKKQIIDNNWHLEPRLSVRDVASRMGTNETYLSRTLNQGLGQSFNTFINGLRVEHAKNLLQGPKDSVLNIAFDSGFNSKATFNRVFRDIAGQTPTQYKTSQLP